jgi:hypothetical protein
MTLDIMGFKMNTQFRTLLSLRGTGSIVSIIALAATVAAVADSPRPSPALPRPASSEPTGVPGWTTAAWNGNDKPFEAARILVESNARKPGFDKYVSSLATAVQNTPDSPTAAFAWAYAAWLNAVQARSQSAMQETGSALLAFVQRGDFAHTYDGSRLRFLCECEGRPNKALVGLGERLLRRGPDDVPVELELAGMYLYALVQGQCSVKDRIVGLCQKVITNWPDHPVAYAILSHVYEDTVYECDHHVDGTKLTASDRADIQKAIELREQSIRLTSENDKAMFVYRNILKQLKATLSRDGSP